MRRAVVALAMSAVAVTGCSASGSGGSTPAAAPSTVAVTPQGQTAASPNALVAASFDKVSEARSARLALSFQLTVPDEPAENVSFAGSGVQDFANKTAQLTVDAPGGMRIEQRLIDKTMYIKLPPGSPAANQLGGKTWLKTDLDKAAQAAGLDSAGGGATGDPTQILRMLTDVSDEVTTVGTEQVRGTDATHYRATVDLTKAATQQGNSPEQAKRLEQLLGTSTMPVDVWISADGLPRRMAVSLPIPLPAAAGAGSAKPTMKATTEFFDFGTPVSVTAPSAAETAELPLPSGGSGSGGSAGTGTGATAPA